MVKGYIENTPIWLEDMPLDTQHVASIFAQVKPGQIEINGKAEIWRGIRARHNLSAFEGFEIIGHITLKDLALLKERQKIKKEYPEGKHIQQHLIQKIRNKQGDRSLIYMLPLQDEKGHITAAELYEKKRTASHTESTLFMGCVGQETYQAFLKKEIPLESAHEHPYIQEDRIQPEVTFPLYGYYYQTEKETFHEPASIHILMAIKKEKLNRK